MAKAATQAADDQRHPPQRARRRQVVAEVLDEALFGPRPRTSRPTWRSSRPRSTRRTCSSGTTTGPSTAATSTAAARAPFGVVNFPAEFAKLRKMIDNRDRRIWAVAQGKTVPATIDDSDTGELVRRSRPTSKRPDPASPSPEEAQKTFKLPEGYEINLFASEEEFPDLQEARADGLRRQGPALGHDHAVVPDVPARHAGQRQGPDLRRHQRRRQGRQADRLRRRAPRPHRHRAGRRRRLRRAAAEPDVPQGHRRRRQGRHARARSCTASTRPTRTTRSTPSPGTRAGRCYFQEGTFHYSQVETPYGPERVQRRGHLPLRAADRKFDVFVSYGFANPWGHYVDRWGQNFVADASGGANYFGTAFSGQVDYPHKHGSMKQFLPEQWRPTCGCELVSSRNFPDDTQGNYLLNNDIGFQGILRYQREGETARASRPTRSSRCCKSSRPELPPGRHRVRPRRRAVRRRLVQPADRPHAALAPRPEPRPRARPDLADHLQEPARWSKPAKIAGAAIAELLDLLKAYEDRTRYRARRELREPARRARCLASSTSGSPA